MPHIFFPLRLTGSTILPMPPTRDPVSFMSSCSLFVGPPSYERFSEGYLKETSPNGQSRGTSTFPCYLKKAEIIVFTFGHGIFSR